MANAFSQGCALVKGSGFLTCHRSGVAGVVPVAGTTCSQRQGIIEGLGLPPSLEGDVVVVWECEPHNGPHFHVWEVPDEVWSDLGLEYVPGYGLVWKEESPAVKAWATLLG